ncbi:MAG: hypothetical protein K8R92_11495 [Planctomycetes bacterium]|nr:hypothetical protein [Planctomycetota bacterium]
MPKTNLQAACLAVGLVSAWAPVASADVVTEVRNNAHLGGDLTHTLLMFSGTGSGAPGIVLTDLMISPECSCSWGVTNPASEFGDSFAMLGLAGGTGSGSGGDGYHLVMSFGSLTRLFGNEFSTAFPGFQESAIIDSLLTDTQLAQAFLRAQFGDIGTANGKTSGVVAFSEGVDFGTVNFSVVPVPAPSAFACLPFYLLQRRRRR